MIPKIIFKDFNRAGVNNQNGEFFVEDYPEILETFKQQEPKLKEYLIRKEEIYQMIKTQKEALSKIKYDFDIFVSLNYPEVKL